MLNFILICCLMSFRAQEESPLAVEHRTPLNTRLSFTISSDRAVYYPLESVRFVMILRNESDNDVRGRFAPSLEAGNLDIYYRRQGEEFVKYRCARQERPPFIISLPKTIKPHQEVEKEEILVFDTGKRRFVLEEPGVYEFKVIYRDIPDDPNARVESNIVSAQVEPAPGAEIEALKAYQDENMALLVQQDKFETEEQLSKAIERSAWFIKTYPHSIYATHVRDRLVWTLNRKVLSQRVTDAERQLYDTLLQQKR